MAKRKRKRKAICDTCTWRNVDCCHHPSVAVEATDMYDGRPVLEHPPVQKVRTSEKECPLYEPLKGVPKWFTEYVRRTRGVA